jgi:hypothetical protein
MRKQAYGSEPIDPPSGVVPLNASDASDGCSVVWRVL